MSEIISDIKNSLMKRREVKMIIESNSNPTMDNAKELVAKEFAVEADRIAVKLVKGKFGTKNFLIEALIYDSADILKQIEPVAKKKVAK